MSALIFTFAQWLIRRSAAALPEDGDRYAEQWLADLEDRGTLMRKFRFALGVWRASVVLRQEWVRASRTIPDDLDDEFRKARWEKSVAAAFVLITLEVSPRKLSRATRARAVRWLKKSPENIRELIEMTRLNSELREAMRERPVKFTKSKLGDDMPIMLLDAEHITTYRSRD